MHNQAVKSTPPEPKKILDKYFEQMNEVIVDKTKEVELAMICILSEGHLLLEGRPGVGKTSLVKAMAKLLGLSSQRIQFTNDMLPADIIGTSIFNKESNKFEFHHGPIFANFILADEINRATPKSQSATLQAMEERTVNIDGQHFVLPRPFYLFATQNPQDNVGTFALPESQLDRFLMRVNLSVPSREAEKAIIQGENRGHLIDKLEQVMQETDLENMISLVEKVHCSESVLNYLLDVVEKSRVMAKGLSTRATQDFLRASKAKAFIQGRDYVIPEDVQFVGVYIMNHRLEMDVIGEYRNGYELAEEILETVEVS
ncbi:MAG: AAA family ATPase [Bdellovibrionales bacterium]